MAQFLIESPHTKEECLRALDEQYAKNPADLEKFQYACASGDHRGFAIVDAVDATAAKLMVPAFVRGKATAIPVSRVTPQQLHQFHQPSA